MWLSSEEELAVDYFWEIAGDIEPYPRSLEYSITMALPVAIIKLPHLALGNIENWFRSRHISYSFNCESRFVRGCLIAYGGKGFIFCDGTDSLNEIRFTLAHEVGHFLIDYWYPRQKAINKFGVEILEVFDGLREPTVAERIQSIFERTKIGTVSNLMDRQDASESIWAIEDQADRVGFALLAPPNEVLRNMDFSQNQFSERFKILSEKLTNVFGLPPVAASTYSNALLRHIGRGPTWSESLRLG